MLRPFVFACALVISAFIAAIPAQAAPLDVRAAMAPRTLGNPKAPVHVDEYSSLDCPHCARFSKNVFDDFKTKYIDTGKVFYTSYDFPLHDPALVATMVARCLPSDRYFQFTKFLFDTQDRWVPANYTAVLRGDAKLLGMGDAEFDACTNNADLKNAISGQMQDAMKAKKIESTPTFIINGMQTLTGETSMDKFSKVIDPMLGAAAPAAPAAK